MTKEYSYSYAIFMHTLNTIEQHKAEHGEEQMTMKQALNWWDRTPEFAKQNLREHTFLGRETFNTIYQFYWGEE